MATTSSSNEITEGTNRTSQAVRREIQYKQGLCCPAGRFSISAIDAWSRLQRLLLKENPPLQDHAIILKRLARIAYSHLPETQQQRYILDDFTQFLNNIGLHHQLQTKGVTTIEAALQEGEAYL